MRKFDNPAATAKRSISLSVLLLLAFIIVHAQTGSIKGEVKTSDNKPAAQVSIQLKEIKKGTTTVVDGSFLLKDIKEGNYTIIVSFVGLQTMEKQVAVVAGQTSDMGFTLAENANQLTEVVITANRSINERAVSIGKLAIKPMDLPQSIAVITKDVLERQQTLHLSEALVNVNGVYVYGTTGGGQEEIGGRGYAFNSSNTFKNGARFNNGVMPEMSSLEKVEVLKGSAAILFGNVAAGGVLNLVTKKPSFDKGGEITMRAGSFSFYKPSFDIYGPINKNIAYRVNTSYEKSNSFRDNVHSERYYINPSFLFKIGKKTDLLVEGDYLKDTRTSDFGVAAVNYQLVDIPRSRFIGAAWSYYNTEQKTATATITHHINSNWNIRSISSYQYFNSELAGTTRPNASGQLVKTNGDWVRGLQRSGAAEDYYVSQLDFSGSFKTGNIKHTMLVGADADKYVTDAAAYTYANAAIGNKNIYDTINVFDLGKYRQRNDIPEFAATTITHTPIKRYGVYVQDLICIATKLKLLAGVRYTYQETSGAYIDSLTKQKRTFIAGASDNAFSPRLGIVYQPWKTLSIFTSYSNSFTLNTGTDINLQPIKPSYINQYEAGVKSELFNRNISANITVYQIVNSNLAQTALLDANGNANNNTNIKELAGEVTSKGVEIDLGTKAFHGFQVLAGYSFNETKYTKSNTYIVGSKLRYNPQHTANASVYYTFSERTLLKGFNAGIVTYYVGDRVAGRSTTAANPGYKLMTVPDYLQFDASVGYTVNKITMRLKLSNLLNKLSYYVHDDNSVNPIAPRQLAATVSFKL